MRNTWAGTHAVVKTAKTRVTSHSVIGAIHSSAVLHIVLKKPPSKLEIDTVAKKKRKGNSGKKRGVAETNDGERTQEDDTSVIDVKPAPKGTTAHFIMYSEYSEYSLVVSHTKLIYNQSRLGPETQL